MALASWKAQGKKSDNGNSEKTSMPIDLFFSEIYSLLANGLVD